MFIIFIFQFDTPTYNPQLYAMRSNVLRAPRLLTPSERRKFADAERQRLSAMNRGATQWTSRSVNLTEREHLLHLSLNSIVNFLVTIKQCSLHLFSFFNEDESKIKLNKDTKAFDFENY